MVYTEEQLAEKIAKLPKYTVREEQANVITHFIGMIIGIIGLLIMFSFAIVRTIRDINNFVDIISSLVFGGSMVALYTMSTVYHNEKNLKKRVFRQKFDHLSINILIAGSCSAFMISGLKNNIGYILISCVWALSILSMVLNWINVKKFRAVTMVIYILTGWAPIIVVNYVIAICGIGWGHPLDGHHHHLHHALHHGHGAHIQVPAIVLQAGVQNHRHQALGGLHNKGGHPQRGNLTHYRQRQTKIFPTDAKAGPLGA